MSRGIYCLSHPKLDLYVDRKKISGLSLLEALVSTAIIGIGFVAIFQMTNYSVQSIYTSGERTKANYLTSLIAEDVIGNKKIKTGSARSFSDFLSENTDDIALEQAAEALAAVENETGRTTDPVRMYMREMGTVELLNRAGEIVIAKKIEEGQKLIYKAII